MGKLKKAYKNMSVRKALILTVAVSLLSASVAALAVAVATRPGYYALAETGTGEKALILHDIFTTVCILISVCVIVSVGTCIFYQQKLSRPLQVLADGVESIAGDCLEFSMSYESDDELGQLCKSFDRMREELQLNYKKLWRMTEERKKLNASFAHDLRTPLTVLRGYVDFLEEYLPSPEKKEKKLLETNRMMAAYITRLEEYVEVMNRIQKLEDTPIRTQEISMKGFVEMLEDNLKVTAKEYRKEFSVVDETALQAVCGDISLIFRVIENVCCNAFRYAESRVWVHLFDNGRMLLFEVIDDGPGFDATSLEQALNPFYTSGQSDSPHFGLGLNICKILCENHGGSISISNTKDSNARVEFSFLLKK